MHFMSGCHVAFDPGWLGFTFSMNACGRMMHVHCFTFCTATWIMVLILNVGTVRAMHKANKV